MAKPGLLQQVMGVLYHGGLGVERELYHHQQNLLPILCERALQGDEMNPEEGE